MCPIDLEELRYRGAVDAPINAVELREGKRGHRGPRQVRIWKAKAVLPNGKPTEITCAYSVPLKLDSLRKQMRNSIARDQRLREIQGDGQDGIYYATVYRPRQEAPVAKEQKKDPLQPKHEVTEPSAQWIGRYITCPACINHPLRRVMQEVADQTQRILTLECHHEVIKHEV